jgi:Spy/CpxP family protein refolding chaperone
MRAMILSAALVVLGLGLTAPAAACEGQEECTCKKGEGHGDKAEGEGKNERKGHGRMLDHLSEAVELTDEQREAIGPLHEAKKAAKADLKETFSARHDELVELWKADELDRDAILAASADIHRIQGEMDQLKLTYKLDILDLLTDEQRVEAKVMFLEHMAGHGQKGGHGDCKHGNEGGEGSKGCQRDHHAGGETQGD